MVMTELHIELQGKIFCFMKIVVFWNSSPCRPVGPIY